VMNADGQTFQDLRHSLGDLLCDECRPRRRYVTRQLFLINLRDILAPLSCAE